MDGFWRGSGERLRLFFVRMSRFAHVNICRMKKRDPFDLQALAETREEIEFQREQRMARFRDQVKAAMSTKDGREMIFSILDLCQLQVSSFNTNALSMAFAEGRRSVGLDLQGSLDPDLYLLMLREQHDRRKH